MPSLATYWPGKFWADITRTLKWLEGQQGPQVSDWLANALITAGATSAAVTAEPASGLFECGIESLVNFATGLTASGAQKSPLPQTNVENIVLALPRGLFPDAQQGPDGYPINSSPIPMPWGGLLCNSFEVTAEMIAGEEALLYDANSNVISAGPPLTAGVIAKWWPGTRFQFGQMIVDTNDNTQMALVDGVTCSASAQGCGNNNNAPNWPATLGALTGDYQQVWKLISLGYKSTALVVRGWCFNLINPRANYRVDVFSHTDVWYYEGSSSLYATALGANALASAGTFSVGGVAEIAQSGLILAVLYPTSVPAPASGWYGSTIPAGWVAHSNMGTGYKLENYKAQIYVKTDIEYLEEDNIPLMVEADEWHCRVGSSVWDNPTGTPTVHVLYNDPVNGWTEVYSSLQADAAYAGLVRGSVVPPSDPDYVPDPGATNADVIQNRSWIYDDGLALLVFTAAGAYSSAQALQQNIHTILENPGFMPNTVLENEQNGTANWSKSDASATVALISASLANPPGLYGGSVIEFESAAANDYFTFIGAGLPDSTDSILEFQFAAAQAIVQTWQMDVGVTTASGKVTDIQITDAAAGNPSLSGTTVIIPIGNSNGEWHWETVNIGELVTSLAGDTLTKINSFKLTLLNASQIFYLFDLTVGGPQPAGSLDFSYDVYNGSVGDVYLRTGSIAWIVYGMAAYAALTQDYTFLPDMVAIINYLLTLQSKDADLRNGLFYVGNGYYDSNYTFHPGPITTCSMEHNLDCYFAFNLAAQALDTAVTQQSKTGAISSATASAWTALATTLEGVVATIAENLVTVMYCAPSASAWAANTVYAIGAQIQDAAGNQWKCVVGGTSGAAIPAFAGTYGAEVTDNTVTWELQGEPGDAGHFSGGCGPPAPLLGTYPAADGSGIWAALFADAIGRDDIAVECLKYIYEKFLLKNQTIPLSNVAATWNEAYQEATPFDGIKFYQDLDAPQSVSMEMTWSYILALLRLYSVNGLSAYFAGLGTTLDAVIQDLVTGQYNVLKATGDGSLLGYSLASRGLPWEFSVTPSFSPAAWMWLAGVWPGLPLAIGPAPTMLPVLQIPKGQSQTLDDKEGTSSVGSFTVDAIDPSGTLKALAAEQALIGATARLKMGFPGLAYGDFVTLHTVQISEVGWDEKGRVTLTCADLQRWIQGAVVWAMGGPGGYTPQNSKLENETATAQPAGASWLPNAFLVSDKNPRWVQGNPIDIVLAVLQNELGVGQDPALTASLLPSGSSAMGLITSNPFWKKYVPGDDSTLINPNQFIDVPGILALRDGLFGGNWFEFKITSPMQAKSWIEMYILKPLGLVTVVHADGTIGLKPMKPVVAP